MRKRGRGQQGPAARPPGGPHGSRRERRRQDQNNSGSRLFSFSPKSARQPRCEAAPAVSPPPGARPGWGQGDGDGDGRWAGGARGRGRAGVPAPPSPNEWPGVQAPRQDGAAAAVFVSAALSPALSAPRRCLGLGARYSEGPGWGGRGNHTRVGCPPSARAGFWVAAGRGWGRSRAENATWVVAEPWDL